MGHRTSIECIVILLFLTAGSMCFGQKTLHDSVEDKLQAKDYTSVTHTIDAIRNVSGVHDTMLAYTFHWEGLLATTKDRDSEAAYQLLLHADSLMETASPLSRVKLWANLATEAYRTKRYTIAKNYLEKSKKIIEQYKLPTGTYRLRIMLTFGSLCINEGDMEAGLAEFLKAGEMVNQGSFDASDFNMRIIGSIGFAYDRMEQYDNAIPYHLASYKMGKSNSILAAHTLSILASDYSRIKRQDSALFWIDEALDLVQRTTSSTDLANVRPLRVKASIFNRTGDHKGAIRQIRKVIAILEKARGKLHRSLAQSYYDLGLYLMYDEQYEEANTHIHRAMLAAGKPKPGSPWLTYLRFLTYRGSVHIGQARQGDERWLDSAEVVLLQADRWIDSLKHRNRGARSDRTLFAIARKTYSNLIEVMLARYHSTSDKHWLEKAFLYGEKGKSVRLMENRWAQQTPAFSHISATILTREQRINEDWERLNKATYRFPDSVELQGKKLAVHQERNLFLRELKEHHHPYYQLKYESPSPNLASIQPQLVPDAWLVSYYVSEEQVHAFAMSKDDVITWDIRVDADLEQHVAFWQKHNTNQELAEMTIFSKEAAERYAELTAMLYQTLLGPVMKQKPKQLYIVPDGELNGLSFGTLSTAFPKDVQIDGFHDIPYLIKEVNISYLPAANALLIPQSNPGKGSYLGFAPTYRSSLPDESSRGSLGPLLHNKHEVEFAAARMHGKAILGKDAHKQAFLRNAPGAKLLHLALHAIADERNPMQSALFFSENEYADSGTLHAYEIYGLSLQADLAILSACQSGNGPLVEAEGILSLGRAFQYAGCSNLLVTQWKTDDKASLSLMHAFFQKLEKQPIAHALRQAKMHYLEHEDLAHPYYWGGWLSIGKNKTVALEKDSYAPWLITCIIFIISFLGLKKEKNRNAVD